MDERERLCYCALNMVFGYTPAVGLELCRHFGSASAVFDADPEETGILLGKGSAKAEMIRGRALEDAERELENVRKEGAGFICIADDDYPRLLREIPDPPLGLYYKGVSPPWEIFNSRPAVAVVGTRRISRYGEEWCRRITCALAEANVKPVIVSGLAYGTDIIAHRTAVEKGLPTIGVMASGIDMVYPWRHIDFAGRLASSEGCALVTDYPIGCVPVAYNFLRRNRIIAGLSSAVIVVESRLKGGSMHTAGFATDYNRDLYALPGRVDDECSQGCLSLIRSQRAEAIFDVWDLVDRLGLGFDGRREKEDLRARAETYFRGRTPPEMTDMLMRVLSMIIEYRGIGVDGLCRKTGLGYPDVWMCASRLEAEGFINIDLMQRCAVNIKNA